MAGESSEDAMIWVRRQREWMKLQRLRACDKPRLHSPPCAFRLQDLRPYVLNFASHRYALRLGNRADVLLH